MHSHVHDHETRLCSHTSPNHSCHSILSPCSLLMRSYAFLASNRIVQLNLLNTQAGMGMCFLACTCSQAHNPKFTTKNIHTVFFFLVHLCTQFQHLFFESQARSLSPVWTLDLLLPQSVSQSLRPGWFCAGRHHPLKSSGLCSHHFMMHTVSERKLSTPRSPASHSHCQGAQECMFLFLLYLRWTKLMN